MSTRTRRRHERIEALIPCRLVVPGAKGDNRFEAHAQLKDISLGGVFVASGFLLKEDVDIVLELKLPDETVAINARVARRADEGMGLQFQGLTKKELAALVRHVVPDEHRAFYDDSIADLPPALVKALPLPTVSLVLHLWHAWSLKRQDAAEAPPAPPKPSSRR
jgi:hypothetical protein